MTSPPCAQLYCLPTCKHLIPAFSDLTFQMLVNETYSNLRTLLLVRLKFRHLRCRTASSIHITSTRPLYIAAGLGDGRPGLPPRTVDDGFVSTPLLLCPPFQRPTTPHQSTSPIYLGLVFSSHAFTTLIPIISQFAKNHLSLPIASL